MSRSNEISHRRHSIKTMRSGSRFQARAFRAGKPVGDTYSGATQDEAVCAVKDFLDARAAEFRGRRGQGGFPCAGEIRAALATLSMNKVQEAMLFAHLAAPDHVLTATQLAQAAGYDDYAVANRQYGQLAHDLACELEWTPAEETNGTTTWTFTLADDADRDARRRGDLVEGQWRWRLRPEVVEALVEV